MTEQAIRYNKDKPKLSLIDLHSFEDCARVLDFGTKKYSKGNWKKGFPVSEIVDSLLRHVAELMEGKDIDDESNLPIIGHIQCNVMFLAHTLKNHPEFDDRINDIKKEENYE